LKQKYISKISKIFFECKNKHTLTISKFIVNDTSYDKNLLYNHDRNGLEVSIGSGLDIKKFKLNRYFFQQNFEPRQIE
jgi:hypothetical protein